MTKKTANREERSSEPALQAGDGATSLGRGVETITSQSGPCFLPPKTIADYLSATGVPSDEVAAELRAKHGSNKFEIPLPTFPSMLLKQLLTPIPIFQLFCCVLWLLEDDYWKYMIFSLISIIGFEFSTVVQKRNNLVTLQGIGKRTEVPVKVLRRMVTVPSSSAPPYHWIPTSSADLVPGDLIQLSAPSIVPCDVIVVGGLAVVNEATLTGESVPQMKVPLESDGRSDAVLDSDGESNGSVLCAGTALMQVTVDDVGSKAEGARAGSRAPTSNPVEQIPVGSPCCYAIVHRTGASSAHGSLLRMIEASQQEVSHNKVDTIRLLAFLLLFAIIAAGYVLYERFSGQGNQKLLEMSYRKLALRCVMILTSVVPPELPMQMALAVNAALLALQKAGILCTEPAKVVSAGLVEVGLFDKTGTLTSDLLRCAGESREGTQLTSLSSLSRCLAATCHSLVSVDSKLVGDPIELAALAAAEGASFDAATGTALVPLDQGDFKVRDLLALPRMVDSTGSKVDSVQLHIVHRFQFSSSLKRMSVVVKSRGNLFLFVKGSPEAILPQLISPPADYQSTYDHLSSRGYRVLAFAYRPVTALGSRAEMESGLLFLSFAAFSCPLRSDTGLVLSAMRSAKIPAVMVTGDGVLTAVHVAEELGIGHPFIILNTPTMFSDGTACTGSDCLDTKGAPLATTGDVLDELVESTGDLNVATKFSVLARMNPQQKERLVQAYRSAGIKVMMVGDGGNDVGALKGADVGLALLGGFGGANTEAEVTGQSVLDSESILEADQVIKSHSEQENAKLFQAAMATKRKELTAFQQQWMTEELAKVGGAENAGFSGHFTAIKAVTNRLQRELEAEAKILREKFGVSATWGGSGPSAETKASVSIGDASIAASFTSRAPSIRAVLQIIRQGRCTLLVAVQQMQIMMLESLIAAYTMAAVTMEGGKTTELQLIFSGILVLVASVSFTYAKPANRLSSVIPLGSVFHPAVFLSVICQVLLHLSVMVYALQLAKSAMGEVALKSLYDFEKARDDKLVELMGEGSAFSTGVGWDYFSMFKSVPYKPNLLNTVMFLVKTAQQVAVLVVNYKGRPWMQGATENKALFLACFLCGGGLFLCSSGAVPALNEFLELMVLPGDLRVKVFIMLFLSSVGAFLLDRAILFMFAREIFIASTWEPILSTRASDFLPILQTLGIVIAGIIVVPVVLSNPLFMVGAYYAWQYWKKMQQEATVAKVQKAKDLKEGKVKAE